MSLKVSDAVDRLFANGSVLRIFVGVVGIGVDLGAILTGTEESEWDIEIARSPVGHAAQEPFLPFAARQRDVFGGHAGDGAGFVPCGRSVADEFERGLILVGGR